MKKKILEDIRSFLDPQVTVYNRPEFIVNDPISVVHTFSKKEDIEICGFLSSTIAWGQRKTIVRNAKRIMELMDNAPYDFIKNHEDNDLERFEGFVHRTFNAADLQFFIHSLKNIYQSKGGLEYLFSESFNGEENSMKAISSFKKVFFEPEHLSRTEKHVSDPMKGSSAKRLNMFLRWMVRKDENGVDFGIWKSIPMSKLSIPLDVHTGNVSRQLGLLNRKQNDIKAVNELDQALRFMDANDPVKYDFALFGLGESKFDLASLSFS